TSIWYKSRALCCGAGGAAPSEEQPATSTPATANTMHRIIDRIGFPPLAPCRVGSASPALRRLKPWRQEDRLRPLKALSRLWEGFGVFPRSGRGFKEVQKKIYPPPLPDPA